MSDQNMDSRIDVAVRQAEVRKREVFDRAYRAEAEVEELRRRLAELEDQYHHTVGDRDSFMSERDSLVQERDDYYSRMKSAEGERDRMYSYCERMLSAMQWDLDGDGVPDRVVIPS